MSEVQVSAKETLLTEAQRQEITSARKELARALDDMVVAIRDNQSVQRTADDLKEKGWWSAFKGTVSGSNDRDLASMIKGLSGSLETTQIAVQLLCRLQIRKDHVLREFHSVLVEKIQKIQADNHTLDASQQSAVDVLGDFKDQIEAQLSHNEATKRHGEDIAYLKTALNRNELEIQQGLQALGDQTVSLKTASLHLGTEVESIRNDLNSHTAFCFQELKSVSDNQQALKEGLESLRAKNAHDFAALQRAEQGLMELVDGLKKQHVSDITVLTKKLEHLSKAETDLTRRTESLESQLAKQSSLASWLKRNAVALLGLGISGLAFAQGVLR